MLLPLRLIPAAVLPMASRHATPMHYFRRLPAQSHAMLAYQRKANVLR
jgi:hypothetical protein